MSGAPTQAARSASGLPGGLDLAGSGVFAAAARGKGHDRLVLSEWLVGVADGATPLSPGWPDPGGLASCTLATVRDLAADAATRGEPMDARGLWLAAIRRGIRDYGRWGHRLTSSAAWLRRCGDGMIEVSALGDCTIVLWLRAGERLVLQDDRVRALDATVSAASVDSRERLLRAHRELANSPGGYWVVGDSEVAADHCLTARVAEDDVLAALLTTDGLAAWARTDMLETLRGIVEAEGVRATLQGPPPDDVAAVLCRRRFPTAS